jgi:hypothetical protein
LCQDDEDDDNDVKKCKWRNKSQQNRETRIKDESYIM